MPGLGMAIAGLGKAAARGIKKHAGKAVSTAATLGMGMGLSNWSRRRQTEQAGDLMEQQIKGQKEMGRFNKGLAMQTAMEAPSAQRAGLEAAGLNVGLMYGGGGPGGVTSQPGSVSGQQASGGMDPMAGLAMMQQMKMNDAQIELMKAQTGKTNAEAVKTAGIDTELGQAQVNNLKQVTQNQAIQGAILEYDKQIRSIEANIAGQTQEDIVRTVKGEADKVIAQAEIERNNKTISDETYNEVIKQAKIATVREAMNLTLQKAQLENINAQTDKTQAQTRLTDEQVKMTTQITNKYIAEYKKICQDMGLDWGRYNQKADEIAIQRTMADFNTSDAAHVKQWTSVMKDVSGSFRDILDAVKPF